ncbi:TetR/AcrR family transcriptional regulator [Parasphingopyxis sp.]|uniref:TetR/AcrR family transcriptional regulator n=1 Tax=Parasphingopyxis sp. TaxID=1920299 RepID=UPI00262A0912|nr:TetR/AcrR family transcriptional regulator [Parasphingopyxis sp.]
MTDEDSDTEAPARAGRPTDERKTEAILDAAREAFFGQGYAAASIERIAEQAGVSKVTIYKRFGDKAGLLEALVRRQADNMTTTIGEANRDAATLEVQLVNFGFTLLSFLFDESHFHFDSMLVIERDRQREAAQRFFDAGPGTMRRELTKMLAAAHKRGDVHIPQPQRAAEDLLSLWKGFADLELRFGVVDMPGPARIRSHVRHGVKVFLRAYRAE